MSLNEAEGLEKNLALRTVNTSHDFRHPRNKTQDRVRKQFAVDEAGFART
jgi:hypothetical protein